MIALALGLLLAATPVDKDSASGMEQQAARHVLREFERVGRRAPTRDEPLTAAARRLARGALQEYTTGAPDLFTLTAAVSDAGAADPSPYSLVIRSWVPRHAVETFLARKDFHQEPATHFGVGVAVQGQRAALVLLLAERKATLQDFPRELSKAGEGRGLCGELASHLRQAQVFVTRPNGKVENVPLTREQGSQFCARPVFDAPGAYTVEVVGSGRGGPEVASLFLVQVGPGARGRGEREPERVAEPTSVPAARQEILERINALRRAHGLGPMEREETLEKVAQAYSERMAREGFFAHVAPDGSTLRSRLPQDGPAYRTAGENLGMAAGPLAAHFGIEHSPGHRKNLLEPRFNHAGIGIAFQKVEGRDQAIVTEVYSVGAPTASSPDATPLDEAYRTLAQHRALRKLPPLERSEVLEQIAFKLVKRAMELDRPSPKLPDFPVHERVFAVLPDAKTATVDFYVVSDPYALPDARALSEATNNRFGIGLLRGDSPTFGRNQYWVAVIYAAVR
jgi:uncharacterized protein YkwD